MLGLRADDVVVSIRASAKEATGNDGATATR